MTSRVGLDAVAGHEGAKALLRETARALSQGRLDVVPMGYLICGPVGTGKSFIVQCFAKDIGIPVVELLNFRSKWQGQTEANLERVLALLDAIGPVAVVVDEADAALLIGDPALRISLGIEKDSQIGAEGQTICPAATLGITSSEMLYVYDVVSDWQSLTGLPAVLAVWAARRDVATPEVTADFLASRDFGLSHIAEISYDASFELELQAQAIEAYLRRNIDFSLDAENRRGLDLYYQHAARLGLIAAAKPIEWVEMKAVPVKL